MSAECQKNEPRTINKQFLAGICPSLGIGAKKGVWSFEHDCFAAVVAFLRALFL